MIALQLFFTFFLIGLFTFGGGYAMIPMIEEHIVSNGWISSSQLTDFIAISESTPGPFAINIATFVGNQVYGVFGAVCATLGVVTPSIIVILIVAILLNKFMRNKYVKSSLITVRPIVISLILSTTIILLTKILLFNGNELYSNEVNFDKASLTLLLDLSVALIIYKKSNKKSLNPIILLLISAGLGIFIFGFLGL